MDATHGVAGAQMQKFTPTAVRGSLVILQGNKVHSQDLCRRNTTPGRVQFFSSNTKITALKSAVNSFIDAIATGNPDSKIAIVKFAGDKKRHGR